jgi:4-amino-4-deoxychorismate lyase
MYRLFETIRLQDGTLHQLEYHNLRLNHSRKTVYNTSDYIDLEQVIQIPFACRQGLFKCKVIYGKEGINSVAFEPYTARTVNCLRLIEDNGILYNHKYTDRGSLTRLLTNREQYDEILIVQKGFITDTSYSNIIFFDGVKWFTPSTPLLKGTMRSFLLENNLIEETKIRVNDLKNFQKARLINAMIPFESGKDIKIENIGY